MNKKIAIINNKCYQAKNSAYAKSIIEKIRKDICADMAFSEYAGHAEKIAKGSKDYGIIIAVGGDGTVSEVVNGMDLETQVLAVMPFGTANSLCRDLGIRTPITALETIKKNKTAKIDLMNCQFETSNEKIQRYGVVTSGFGFASATAAFANRYIKMTGSICYSLSACFNLFSQEVISAKMQLDESPFDEIEFTNLLINNTKHAGNACVFPRANLRDSAFNLLFTKTNALTQYLWNVSVITKTYFYYPGEKIANKLHIILQKPSLFMLDGEVYDSVRVAKYSLLPQKLNIFQYEEV